MKKKFVSVAVAISLIMGSPTFMVENKVYAVENPNENKTVNLTLESAIEIAMEKNMILKSLEVDIASAGLSLDKATYNERKIKKGKDKLSDAKKEYIPKIDYLEQMASTLPEDSEQRKVIEGQISQIKEALGEGEERLDSGIEEANSVIAQKLNIDVDRVLAVNSTTELMTTMADLQNEVTKSGYQIAQKQIALLTRQKYYEVIKDKKIEELKKVALDRATKQYEMAKNAFEQGMKAKDDVLLSEAQVKLMNVDYRKAIMERKNAEIELKKVINIDLKTQVNLVEDFTTKKMEVNLEEGIKQGLEKRIEIRKAQAQYLVDKLNFELTSNQYPDNTYQYKETKVKMEKSKVTLESQYAEVEASIRQSYEAIMATEDMLSYTDNVVKNAKESLEIAEYRYNEGYGFETSVIKSASLEDVAGTIVEVIAAQERLTDIEEKVIEVIFNYNLARDKYLNDIGAY